MALNPTCCTFVFIQDVLIVHLFAAAGKHFESPPVVLKCTISIKVIWHENWRVETVTVLFVWFFRLSKFGNIPCYFYLHIFFRVFFFLRVAIYIICIPCSTKQPRVTKFQIYIFHPVILYVHNVFMFCLWTVDSGVVLATEINESPSKICKGNGFEHDKTVSKLSLPL